MADAQPAPAWACFPDSAPPDAVIAGWRALLGLPRPALRNLWMLLREALENPASPDSRQLVESYADRFDANAGNVFAAVRACDFLLRQGASIDVPAAAFQADLERLSASDPAGIELLMPHYGEVRDRLRLRMLEDTLAEHGNVLLGFDWRIDRVTVSNHGSMADTTVVFLNLKYRAGKEERQLALQLPPRALLALKAFWQQFAPE